MAAPELARRISAITAGGQTRGFVSGVYAGAIIVRMPDPATLWIEGIPTGTVDPATWQFTASKTVFVR